MVDLIPQELYDFFGSLTNYNINKKRKLPNEIRLKQRSFDSLKLPLNQFMMLALPFEIIIEILKYLPISSLLNCRRVCTKMFGLSHDPYVWDNLFDITYGKIRIDKTLWSEDYFKEHYIQMIGLTPQESLNFSIRRDCVGLGKSILLQHKEQPFGPLKGNSTFAYLAATRGLTEIVDLLLIHKYEKPDDTRFGDSSPLYVACQEDQLGVAKILIKHGANIEFKYRDGFTPLYVASQRGCIDIVKYLVSIGANVTVTCDNGSTPIYIASQEGRTDVIDFLWRHGGTLETRFRRGFTPIYVASRNGHATSVEKLIELGADVNSRDNDGSSPIYVASQNGHLEVVKALIKANAFPEYNFLSGYTALYVACQNGHYKIAKQLLKTKRVGVDKIMPNGSSPMYIACQNGYHKTVTLLLKYGADHNIKSNGFSTLYVATHRGHYETVKVLLTKTDIDVNFCWESQPYALYTACQKGRMDIVELLVEHGANVKCDLHNQNLLHIAFNDEFKTKIIIWLLDTYPQLLFEEDKNGVTPMELAFKTIKSQDRELIKKIVAICKLNVLK